MINTKSYYILAIVPFLATLGGYWLIRHLIWSIALCNINKKTMRSAEFKARKNISMSYLSEYILIFHKEYVFWMKIKTMYVVMESVWLLIYLLLPLFIGTSQKVAEANLALSIVPAFLLGLQTDCNHLTKFDRYRLNRKAKRKGKNMRF